MIRKPPTSAAAPAARNAICQAGTPEPEPSSAGAPPVVGRPDWTATVTYEVFSPDTVSMMMLPVVLPAVRTAVAMPLAFALKYDFAIWTLDKKMQKAMDRIEMKS